MCSILGGYIGMDDLNNMSDYWKDNNIKKPKQVIVCAACRVDGYMVCGARHFDKVMTNIIKHLPYDLRWPMAEQGFIDQFGEFITREIALEIVKNNGQPFDEDRNGASDCLFSEGLY